MACRVSPYLVVLSPALLAAVLSGCSAPVRPQRPAWRTQAENACLAQRRVEPSAYVQIANEMDGPGICGLTRPFKVTALQGGAVTFSAKATLDCSMVAELDQWLVDVVQPAAQARFGQQVVQINSMGSYACRGMNNQSSAPLSEHSFGNALDIGGFVLADGRQISIVRDWTRGDFASRAFLMDVHGGSCQHFSTVLAPGSNPFHYNHIHVDLAMHGRGGKHICKPVPHEIAAPPPPVSPLLVTKGPAPVEDEDGDTGEPPRAAFEGGREASLDAFSAPLPPRRNESGEN
ncbi:MAG: extensin family protein [Methylocystis sp.]